MSVLSSTTGGALRVEDQLSVFGHSAPPTVIERLRRPFGAPGASARGAARGAEEPPTLEVPAAVSPPARAAMVPGKLVYIVLPGNNSDLVRIAFQRREWWQVRAAGRGGRDVRH